MLDGGDDEYRRMEMERRRVIVGRRVLYNVDKIKKYIDAMAV